MTVEGEGEGGGEARVCCVAASATVSRGCAAIATLPHAQTHHELVVLIVVHIV